MGASATVGALFIFKNKGDTMKKIWLILTLCLTCAFCAIGFTACNNNGGDSSVNNTYYLYKSSDYDETNYIKLTNGKFERLQTIMTVAMPIISGTYEIKDETIDFYATEGGTKAKVYSGTIKEGVLKINSETFCAKGYTPQGKK